LFHFIPPKQMSKTKGMTIVATEGNTEAEDT